ncbi:MAG: nucleoside deaminase [Clostridia bacterium]|nr:nucleoside deaminase [Clostridia bacterium]
MSFTETDAKYMRLALSEAQAALKAGEIPVGCVIVKDGQVIASARNRVQQTGDVTAHAEMLVIRQAGRYALRGAVMYVTLEPCPMCAGAIALCGISRLVYAAKDERYGCCGSVYRIPEDPAFPNFCFCDGGIMEDESRALLNEAFRGIRGESAD